jgi:hypothetical protein
VTSWDESGVVSRPVQVPSDDQRRPDANDVSAEGGREGLSRLGELSRAPDLESTSDLAAGPDGVGRLIVDNQRHAGIALDVPEFLRLVQKWSADFDGVADRIDPKHDRMNLRRAVRADAGQSPLRMGAEVSVLSVGEHNRRVEPQE